MIVFTILISVMSILDAIAADSVHLFNLLYIPIMLVLFSKIMDTK